MNIVMTELGVLLHAEVKGSKDAGYFTIELTIKGGVPKDEHVNIMQSETVYLSMEDGGERKDRVLS